MGAKLTKSDKEALALAGGPVEMRERIGNYTKAVSRLSSERVALTKLYPKEWVAMVGGDIVCRARSSAELVERCQELEIPLGSVAMRYLDTEKRVFIL